MISASARNAADPLLVLSFGSPVAEPAQWVAKGQAAKAAQRKPVLLAEALPDQTSERWNRLKIAYPHLFWFRTEMLNCVMIDDREVYLTQGHSQRPSFL